jgi:hypothetical protein
MAKGAFGKVEAWYEDSTSGLRGVIETTHRTAAYANCRLQWELSYSGISASFLLKRWYSIVHAQLCLFSQLGWNKIRSYRYKILSVWGIKRGSDIVKDGSKKGVVYLICCYSKGLDYPSNLSLKEIYGKYSCQRMHREAHHLLIQGGLIYSLYFHCLRSISKNRHDIFTMGLPPSLSKMSWMF